MSTATRNSWIALSNWGLLIWNVLPQRLAMLARSSKMRFLLYLMEPIMFVMMFYWIRGILRQNMPNYGTSLLLFYASGVMPYYMFLRVSTHIRSVGVGPNRLLPGVRSLDSYIATSVLDALLNIAMTVLLFLCMWLYGIDQARPASIINCMAPLSLFIVLGLGIGMINNVIGRHLPLWRAVYAALTRGLLFLSGVIIITDLTPPWLRNIITINPLSHGVEWFRLGVYGRYPHNSLDKAYLVEWAFIALFLGFVIDRATIRSERR
jgi:capsular polysaccharide transport system permease protein